MRQNWRRTLPGYMTVEASLILPMVLCVYTVLIYTGYFLYNRCLATQDAYILCYRESIHKDESLWSYPDGSVVREEEADQVSSKYLALKSRSTEVSTERSIIRYSGEGSVTPVLFGGSTIMPQDIWTFRYGMSARHTDPPLNIRKVRRVYDLAHMVQSARAE